MFIEDENIVEVLLIVQYKISNLQDFVFNVDQFEVSLQQVIESVLWYVVGFIIMDWIFIEGCEQMVIEVCECL